jgi:methionyl-tRNA formyltransferase
MLGKKLRIVFMGTPDFAVPTLNTLADGGYNVVGVVSAFPRPAGRGRNIRESPIANAAKNLGIPLLQPEKLRNEDFLETYYSLKPDLNVVVAFRMLPKVIWNYPQFGTINLHASLLPAYRGAAPINHALLNGETQTGITTFMINEEIDTGNILLQEAFPISHGMNAGELHDILMDKGASLVIKTIESIADNIITPIPQSNLPWSASFAPKLSKADSILNPEIEAIQLFRRFLALSPYPGVFFEIVEGNEIIQLKVAGLTFYPIPNQLKSNKLLLQENSFIFQGNGGNITIAEIQLPGRKWMSVKEFIKGWKKSDKEFILK